MDIRAISQLNGSYAGAAGVAVPGDSRALITEIAMSTRLSERERSGLIAAVAAADSGLAGLNRTEALQQVQNLGLYLRNTGNEGFPRWTMMTALRSYGMNIQQDLAAPEGFTNLLQNLAQTRQVSVDYALRVVAERQTQAAPVAEVAVQAAPVAEAGGARVERLV